MKGEDYKVVLNALRWFRCGFCWPTYPCCRPDGWICGSAAATVHTPGIAGIHGGRGDSGSVRKSTVREWLMSQCYGSTTEKKEANLLHMENGKHCAYHRADWEYHSCLLVGNKSGEHPLLTMNTWLLMLCCIMGAFCSFWVSGEAKRWQSCACACGGVCTSQALINGWECNGVVNLKCSRFRPLFPHFYAADEPSTEKRSARLLTSPVNHKQELIPSAPFPTHQRFPCRWSFQVTVCTFNTVRLLSPVL